MSDELITSPVGTITFAALNRLVNRKPDDAVPSVYTFRLEFDGDTAEAQEFKAAIEAVNAGLIGTKHATKPGNFTVQASSKFQPKVYDSNGEQFGEGLLPSVNAGGTAVMMVKPFTGNKLGGCIHLIAVGLKDWTEYVNEGAAERKADIGAKIKRQLDAS